MAEAGLYVGGDGVASVDEALEASLLQGGDVLLVPFPAVQMKNGMAGGPVPPTSAGPPSLSFLSTFGGRPPSICACLSRKGAPRLLHWPPPALPCFCASQNHAPTGFREFLRDWYGQGLLALSWLQFSS